MYIGKRPWTHPAPATRILGSGSGTCRSLVLRMIDVRVARWYVQSLPRNSFLTVLIISTSVLKAYETHGIQDYAPSI
jgi:hypothetical protein